MKPTITLCLVLIAFVINAQSPCPVPQALVKLEGNNISAMISNGGDLFWDGSDGQFIAPAQSPVEIATIFAAGLWLGGIDDGGNLRLAAADYGRARGVTDYIVGPLQPNLGLPFDDQCNNFDKIWVVTRQDIEDHLNDFNDNGVIDNPNSKVFAWPGRGSQNIETYNGFPWPVGATAFAPFWDLNGNAVYEPESGEYPYYSSFVEGLLPEMMTWSVFNDATPHTSSPSTGQLQMEVQLLTWNFSCTDNELLNNTIFTAHTLTNHSVEAINTTAGLWVDFDLGCFTDDYIGSSPADNAFFAYNMDAIDGDGSSATCSGVNTYAANPPVQSVMFLNKPMDYFMYYNNGATNPIPGTSDPISAVDYYNFMTAKWQDGTPLTEGGDGYDPNGTPVSHAFSGDPNVVDEWSMFNEQISSGDRRVIGSHDFGRIVPGQSSVIETAYTFHRQDGTSHLENVEQMYDDLEELQSLYDNRFEGVCQSSVLSNRNLIPDAAFSLSPNPTDGRLQLQLHDIELDRLRLFDLQGRQLMEWSRLSGSQELELSHLNPGMYLLKLESEGRIATKKFVRM